MTPEIPPATSASVSCHGPDPTLAHLVLTPANEARHIVPHEHTAQRVADGPAPSAITGRQGRDIDGRRAVSPTDDGVVPKESAGVRPTHEDPPELPSPPKIDRRIQFHPPMIAGLVMVGVLPVLAIFGLFGIGRLDAEAAGELVSFRVEYPRIQRLKVRQPLRVLVTNDSDATLPTVEVLVSSSYVLSFADVAFTPGPTAVLDDDYVFEVSNLAPGATAVIAGEMQAQEYWHQPGSAGWRVLDEEGNETGAGSVEFATLVWP